MEGLNVNLSFESKLATNTEDMNTTFLKIRSCSLHPTHTGFPKGCVKPFRDISKSFIVPRLTPKNHNILILMTFSMTFISTFECSNRIIYL